MGNAPPPGPREAGRTLSQLVTRKSKTLNDYDACRANLRVRGGQQEQFAVADTKNVLPTRMRFHHNGDLSFFFGRRTRARPIRRSVWSCCNRKHSQRTFPAKKLLCYSPFRLESSKLSPRKKVTFMQLCPKTRKTILAQDGGWEPARPAAGVPGADCTGVATTDLSLGCE